MTDISDKQSGELTQPKKKEIKYREHIEINSGPAVFIDRIYVTTKGPSIVISMCEDVQEVEETRLRSRVAMHVPGFLNFADTLTAIAKQIREAVAQNNSDDRAQTEAAKGLH